MAKSNKKQFMTPKQAFRATYPMIDPTQYPTWRDAVVAGDEAKRVAGVPEELILKDSMLNWFAPLASRV